MHFGIPCMSPQDGKWYRHWPEDLTYVTTAGKLEARANAGCVWCRFILGHGMHHETDTVTVTVWGTREKWLWVECHLDYQKFYVKINGSEYGGFIAIYTAPGASGRLFSTRMELTNISR